MYTACVSEAEDWFEQLLIEDAARVRRFLGKMVGAAGLTRRDMDRRLGVGRGYFSNVLNGRFELKQPHVTAILLAAGVHTGIFFDVLYPKNRPFGPLPPAGDSSHPLEVLGLPIEPEPPPAPAPPPAVNPAELKPFIEEIVRQALAGSRSEHRRTGERAKRPRRKRTSTRE
ncbi:MAG: hypothetical protein ACREE7_02695 [Dongiaceae bacterium]